ncbi:MAG: serine/threonine protein kinase [Nitrospirae bacterium]|nr:serine/threonine protein kinase [Nitrospirota bacterium]
MVAVEAGGLRCNNLCYPLNSFENRVYEVELTDGNRVVAKFYRPGRWSEPQILEEHRFLRQLDEADIPVCTVRPFPDGSTLKQIDNIYYSLSDRRGGRAPDELDTSLARRLGMLVGRLHNVAAADPDSGRRPIDGENFIRRPLTWLREHRSIPQALEGRYFRAAEGIADYADRLFVDVDTHRIHGDLHLGNVLLRDNRFNLLDFDDMAPGPAVQDLWLALPGRDEETLRQREVFLSGYEQFRAFDRSSLRLIEALRGLRLVRYAVWLARRWHDPAFKSGWPHFGTFEYWEGETRDLEDQLEVIRKDSETTAEARVAEDLGSGSEVEELLSNRDYFFDWEDES